MEFQGVNLAAIVFVNGQAISGNTRVKQPGVVTHVGSSLPFVVNISKYIKWGEENQIAIKVSNAKIRSLPGRDSVRMKDSDRQWEVL